MKDILFFDIESTGLSITKDRIISLSLIKTNNLFQIIEKKKLLFNPNIPIPKEATEIHHITNETVKDAPLFSQYAQKIFEYFNSAFAIGGYNIKAYDIQLICEEFNRCGITYIPNENILDAYVIFKQMEPRTLAGALKFYCGKIEDEDLHDAEFDNLATIEVLESQMFRYGLEIDETILLCKEGDKNKLDFAGKVILNSDNIAVWSFGKNQGKAIKDDIGYCQWVLGGDFPINTKNIVKALISK